MPVDVVRCLSPVGSLLQLRGHALYHAQVVSKFVYDSAYNVINDIADVCQPVLVIGLRLWWPAVGEFTSGKSSVVF